MRISILILSGFFLILLLFSITTYINHQLGKKVTENADRFTQSSAVLRHSNRFQRNILTMVSGLRGYLLTKEASFLESYDSSIIENTFILADLGQMVANKPAQKRLLAEIKALNDRWLTEFADTLVDAKHRAELSDSSAAGFTRLYRKKLAEGEEKAIQQSLQRKFKEFSNHEYAFREAQRDTLNASTSETGNLSVYLTAFSIVIGGGIAVFLAIYISSRIMKMVKMSDRIADGDYHVLPNVGGRDELGQLQNALNHMAKVLSENFSLLKKKNEELNQFAHIVSHDLKTPLRGIDNVTNWIYEDHELDIPPKVREYIDLIKGRVVRAENMLDGILSYSRVGREIQYKEVVHVNELIEEIREYVPQRPGITLRVQPGLPDLFTERLPLFQVFSNLIVNAFKYHDKPDGEVKVYCQHHPRHYEFFVEDNGPGIAKAYHEKIFVIFQTLQDRDSFESTGVGLAIVKKVLDDRKQTIRVLSEPGKGSVFAFTWPKFEHDEQSS